MDPYCNQKLVKALKKLLEPDYHIRSDIYLNQLLKFLAVDNQATNEPAVKTGYGMVDHDFFILWIKAANAKWILSKKANPNLLSFALQLTRTVSNNEQTFVKLNSENVFENLLDIANQNVSSPIVKLAYVQLMSSFLLHKSGLQWIISMNNWNKVLNMVTSDHNVYIKKEGCKFLANFLQKSMIMNEEYCINVMQMILKPIQNCNKNECEDTTYNSIQQTLHTISAILENLLEEIKYSDDTRLINKVINKFNIGKTMETLSPLNNKDFIFDIGQILTLLDLFDFVFQFGSSQAEAISYEKIKTLSKNMNDKLTRIIETTNTTYVLTSLMNNLRFWSNIRLKMPLFLNADMKPYSYDYQVQLLQLLPPYMFLMNMLHTSEYVEKDDHRDLFNTKVCKNLAQETFRARFTWKKKLGYNVTVTDASLSLKFVSHSQKYYSREAANTSFRSLVYCLIDVLTCIEKDMICFPLTTEMTAFLEILVATIIEQIKIFDITWKEAVESVCLLETALKFLSISGFPSQIVVKFLQFTDVAISKYLSPDMILLIDEEQKSDLGVLTPVLYAKLHDINWEIRDSALEVIHTIVDISIQKFPSYRKNILIADFPSIILRMSKADDDPFVRATAMKCLEKMVHVEAFWRKLTENSNFFDQVGDILLYEEEGIVRKAAAATISTLYDQQEIPEDVRQKFYDIMTHAIIGDLHWEVKVSALDFWQKDIFKHLTEQGMIDGSFPAVTFSTEYKKIVILTELEVRKRLIKILNQLSKTGCLAVFAYALQDDSDVEVSKVAYRHIQCFIETLKKYEVSGSLLPQTELYEGSISQSVDRQNNTDVPNEFINLLYSGKVSTIPSDFVDTDSILEDILDIQDLKLLEQVLKSSKSSSSDHIQMKCKQFMPPAEFLKFIYNDLEAGLNNKAKWINEQDSFESLLDDIIREYNYEDLNTMDCYT